MIYAISSSAVSSDYTVTGSVDGDQIARIDSYDSFTFLLPATLTATLDWVSGTCSAFKVNSHKIGF